MEGKTILIDPVFNDYASPLPFINKAFAGTDIYTADDMPEIDYLLTTHDHWDHLDYSTVMALIFFSGDSGYGPHFAEIGRKFSGFDLVFLDCGQYDKRWAYIHMNPAEAVRAAEDLQAKALLPAHVGKFTIARHPWDEPFIRIAEASRRENIRLLTPRIGEPISLDNIQTEMSQWWKNTN